MDKEKKGKHKLEELNIELIFHETNCKVVEEAIAEVKIKLQEALTDKKTQ